MILYYFQKFDKTYAGWAIAQKLILKDLDELNIEGLFTKGEFIHENTYKLKKIHETHFSYREGYLNMLLNLISTIILILRIKPKVVFLPNMSFSSYSIAIIKYLRPKIKLIGLAVTNEMSIKSKAYILKKILLKKFDKVCVLNKGEYNSALNKYNLNKSQLLLTNNFVDHDFSGNQQLIYQGILFVGLICARKNPTIILEYLSKNTEKFQNESITFIGPIGEAESDPSYVTSFKSFIQSDKISHNINVLGKIPFIEVKNYYQDNCYFILPSFIEGMPGVLLEAMSYGMIIIASDIPGINDIIINNVNGLLFNPKDYNSFENVMNYAYKLTREEKQKIMRNAISTIKAKYTTDKMSKFYKDLFIELLPY